MKQNLINKFIQDMLPYLNNFQIEKLKTVMEVTLFKVGEDNSKTGNSELLELFLSSKRIEGCSEKSLKYYRSTIKAMFDSVNKDVKQIFTDDIRNYLSIYQTNKNQIPPRYNLRRYRLGTRLQ